MSRTWSRALMVGTALTIAAPAVAQDGQIPHAQDLPPGPALSPAEAIRAMTVPEGFAVELVAAEPDVVNPVAMTFDERGRAWITESLEYPRRDPGPGRDRVKVLEDTDGDGRADKFTVFAEGLNIPSGIAVGAGGVWVANSPDILFYPDADRDLVPDGPPQVVCTGFGRDDTHELPNSLTWGPDGWLYGWNGVFNSSKVASNNGTTYEFTCAIFRIHPRTREFQVWTQGTSNPWGIAYDNRGETFASACVIDHLWHLVESAYYVRQGGPYPPYTWPMRSIVDFKHQKAAYCGIHFYDSDAYPAEYRGRLYMGNIHANAINVDGLERKGAGYRGTDQSDFLAANDAWFMPVVQKTGPDGSLYVLDWYDRYHCYQDANRDPAGIDRLKGRLYRIRYKDTPRRAPFDLAKLDDDALIALLGSGNGYDRDQARRLLGERAGEDAQQKLSALALDKATDLRTRLLAAWSLIARGPLDPAFHAAILADPEPALRSWGVRAAGDTRRLGDKLGATVAGLAADPAPEVALQAAIASRKLGANDPVPMLLGALRSHGSDPVVAHVVWQNLLPLLAEPADRIKLIASISPTDEGTLRWIDPILPRLIERLLGGDVENPAGAALVLTAYGTSRDPSPQVLRDSLATIGRMVGEFEPARRTRLKKALEPVFDAVLDAEGPRPLALDAAILALRLGDDRGIDAVRAAWLSSRTPDPIRLDAFAALLEADRAAVVRQAVESITHRHGSIEFRAELLSALGRVDSPELADLLLDRYHRFEPEIQPRVIVLLTERPAWAKVLAGRIDAMKIPASVLGVNQLRKLTTSNDEALAEFVRRQYGTIRDGRNEHREQVVGQMRSFLAKTPGDALAGRKVFDRVCAQCHKIYGRGVEVGPDVTANGRASYEQLVSNVFDPSLVIGTAYQAVTLATTDGRVLTGLLVEDNPQRVVLKLQGGTIETVARDQVEEQKVAAVSLMPEDLEKQITPQELADLFSFLTLDRDPDDPKAQPIPGAGGLPRRTAAPAGGGSP